MAIITEWAPDHYCEMALKGFYSSDEEDSLAMLSIEKDGAFGIIIFPNENDPGDFIEEQFSSKKEAMDFAIEQLKEYGFVSIYDNNYSA